MTTSSLSEDAKKIYELANENLGLLNGKCHEKIEIQDYYLGILRRQAILLLDLSLILKDREEANISTPFIILRSLLDDFLHLLYLEIHKDRGTEIIHINADSLSHCFKSLEDLTNSNDNHFKGKYPFYLTGSQLQEFKDQFVGKEANIKYFKNPLTFKFKSFRKFTDMVKSFSHSHEVDIFKDRAYYLWKEFSSFVHYSNYSFEYELNKSEVNLHMIDESFQYCYNSIYLAYKYFERELKIKFKDNGELRSKYGIIYNC